MAGIALRLGGEGVARDDRLPFRRGAHEEVRPQGEALFGLEQAFQRRAGLRATAEDEVAALEQRADIGEAQRGEEAAQVGHADHLMPGDVDGPEKGDVDLRCGGHGSGGARRRS